MIISCSRRCDIPRFAFDWFMHRLDEGYVEVKNPFNSSQIRRVSLLPPVLFAFWTRDPAHILEQTEELERRGYGFYVMTTLTAYPAILEPNTPPADAVIDTMRPLAEKIPPERLLWRYDPIFLSNLTSLEFHRKNFAVLATRLKGTVKRVIVSVYDEYSGAERRLSKLERRGALKRLAHYSPSIMELSPELRGLLADLAKIAQNEGMEIQSCAEGDLTELGIKNGACIDGAYISETFGEKYPGLMNLVKDKGQKRPFCQCVKSFDIGSYSHCPAECVYCYGLR